MRVSRVSRSLLIGLAMALAALALPAPSVAATTIGSNLATAPGGSAVNCLPVGGCTLTNSSLSVGTQASGGAVAPLTGVVVRWRIRTGSTSSATTPRIIRQVTGTTWVGAGSGTTVTPGTNQTATFNTRLPIKAGDRFGINQAGTSFNRAFVSGSNYASWISPLLTDGGSPRSVSGTGAFELLINADVEADVDVDGYGDETQDLCPGSAATPGAACALTVEAGEGGRVTGPGIDCPGDCAESYPQGTQVDLKAVPDEGFGTSEITTSSTPCAGASLSDCSIFMFGDRTVTAQFGDTRSPQTKITKGPKKKISKRKVKFKFSSDESGSTFVCSLDKKIKGKAKSCTSPYKVKVKPGKHVFYVRAEDPSGLVDGTPAKLKFKVVR